MTLNITLLTADVIYQSADFRLWDPQKNAVVTDTSNKTVAVHMQTWEGAVTYTGIGRWGTKDTSHWIIDWLTGAGDLSFDGAAELLRSKGNNWLNNINGSTQKTHPHTFILTAFVDNVPTVGVLSNFQSFDHRSDVDSLSSNLKLSVIRQTSTPKALVTGCLHESPVSRQQRRYLERLARDHPHDSARIRQALRETNRRASTSSQSCPISEECIVQSFDRGGQGFQSDAPSGVKIHQIVTGFDAGKILDEIASNLLGEGYKFVGGTSTSTGAPPTTENICRPQLSNMQSSPAHEIVELPSVTGRDSAALSVNNAGQAVGRSTQAAGQPALACRWVNQALEFLPNLGGISGQATDINSAGIIAGWIEAPDRYLRGCLWSSEGSPVVLEFEGSYQTAATCIVDGGVVGGWASYDPSDRAQVQNRPTLWASDGSQRSMPNFMADWGEIVAINNIGTAAVRGYIEQTAVTYLWRENGVLDLGPVHPVGIDDSDRVVGFARDRNGKALTLRWDHHNGWQRLAIPAGWHPTANSPDGVIAGSVELNGWTRPWICMPPSPPTILPHFSYHHTTVTRLLDSFHAAGYASTDHGAHAIIWRPALHT